MEKSYMNKLLSTAMVQMNVQPGEVEENVSKCIQFIEEAASAGADLILFPELVLSGYHLSQDEFSRAALPERMSSALEKLAVKSREVDAGLVISYPEQQESGLYITSSFIDGKTKQFFSSQKTMLWGKEKHIFKAGFGNFTPFDTRFGKIALLICYDLEFPEPARAAALQGAELIICPSVWSQEGKNRWEIQIPCRALDNLCFVAGVNRIGEGACGLSQAAAPDGSILVKAQETQETILYADMDLSLVKKTRASIPYFHDYPDSFAPQGLSGKSWREKII